MTEGTKNVLDGVSAATVVGTLFNWLPNIAALAALIWTCLRIYEWCENRWFKGDKNG